MKVEVQVSGSLAARLVDRRVPGVIDVADGTTVAELLRDLGVPESLPARKGMEPCEGSSSSSTG